MSAIFLELKNGSILKDSDDLLYVLGSGSYSMLYFIDGSICRVSKNLKFVTQKYLEGKEFLFRASKSFIINTRQIDKIDRGQLDSALYRVKFRNGYQMEVGPTVKRNLVNYLKSVI